MFCNCTLAGTKACQNCSNNTTIFTNFSDLNWIRVYPWVETYNPETHELVEKKDAKIKRLKDEIQQEEKKLTTCKNVLEAYSNNLKEAEDNIKKLNDELSELEG